MTFSSNNALAVPLQVSYKDDDGNVFSSVGEVRLKNTTSGTGQRASAPGSDDSASFHNTVIHAVMGIVIIAILLVAGLLGYNRMKKR